jgi:hypothetical protein
MGKLASAGCKFEAREKCLRDRSVIILKLTLPVGAPVVEHTIERNFLPAFRSGMGQ